MKLTHKLFYQCAVVCTLLATVFSASANRCLPWSDQFNNKAGLTIGKIKVDTGNIFDLSDPQESRFVHRLSNKLHIISKPRVIRRQLLFKRGDPYDAKKLEESTRLIRANSYIKDVQITPVEVCGNNKVKIIVRTSDKWTLSPGVSFSQSGGGNKSSIKLQDNNLLGFGKSFTLKYKQDSERDEKEIRYADPQFLGSKHKLFTSLNDNSDGKGYQFNLWRPFYSIDDQRTWGTNHSSLDQEKSIYSQGEVTSKLHLKQKAHSFYKGWSNNITADTENDFASRFRIGWNYKKTEYDQLLPLTESYPWFEYKHIKEHFTTRTNFKSMGAIEDVPLGLNYALGIGLLSKELGSSEDHVKLSANVKKGFELKTNLGFVYSDFTSYLGKGRLQGEALNLKAELFTFNDHGSDYRFAGRLRLKNNLQIEEQLLLGGETGLRGYPTGFQNGTQSVVFTAEKRFHFDWYPLHLAKLGAVVFADTGTAWGDGNKAELLTDVGVGLRVIPTRSSATSAVHLDLAFPLDGGDTVDSFQFMLTSKQSF